MLLRDTVESGGSMKILDFRYDQSGAPYSLTYTVGSTSIVYYYITKLQGNVMYLVDSKGVCDYHGNKGNWYTGSPPLWCDWQP